MRELNERKLAVEIEQLQKNSNQSSIDTCINPVLIPVSSIDTCINKILFKGSTGSRICRSTGFEHTETPSFIQEYHRGKLKAHFEVLKEVDHKHGAIPVSWWFNRAEASRFYQAYHDNLQNQLTNIKFRNKMNSKEIENKYT